MKRVPKASIKDLSYERLVESRSFWGVHCHSIPTYEISSARFTSDGNPSVSFDEDRLVVSNFSGVGRKKLAGAC